MRELPKFHQGPPNTPSTFTEGNTEKGLEDPLGHSTSMIFFYGMCSLLSSAFVINLIFLSTPVRSGGRDLHVVHSGTVPGEVDIAYFIQVSQENLLLLPRLLRALWNDKNIYVVHFDKKIPEWERDHVRSSLFRNRGEYRNNVIILESEPVTYRGISMVLNNLNAMQAAMDSSVPWTFFINLSGSDYPLVSPENQRQLLSRSDFAVRNRSFFTLSNTSWWNRAKEFRYDRLFVDTSLALNDSDAHMIDTFVSQPLSNILNFTFVAAEAWMILHRQYVDYLLRSSLARRMLLSFSFSIEPEEHYFSTVAFNDVTFNISMVPHALRHIVWRYNGVHSGQHPYYIDELNDTNGAWIFQDSIYSSACFFTRKILRENSPLLDWIDQHVSGVAPSGVVQTDVNDFLARTSRFLDCLGTLSSGQEAAVCLDALEI